MKNLLQTTLMLAGLALAAFNSAAATRTWTGDAISNDFWTDKDNWNGHTDVIAGDTLIFPVGIQNTDLGMQNTFGVGTVFRRLEFREHGYSVSGTRVSLSQGMRVDSTGNGDPHVAFNVNIRLTANQTFEGNGTLQLNFTSGIELNGHQLTVAIPLDANGPIDGSGGLTVANGGYVILRRANSYTGSTIIESGGSLSIHDQTLLAPVTLGTVGSPTHVHGNLFFGFDKNTTVDEVLHLYDGAMISAGGGVSTTLLFRDITLAGAIQLVAPGEMIISSPFGDGSLLITGVISGSGNLSLRGTASETLASAGITVGGTQPNTFIGSFHVNSGIRFLAKPAGVAALSCQSVFVDPIEGFSSVLRLNASHQIVDTALVTVQERGTFDLQSRFETIRSLTLAGGTVNGSSPGQLDVTQDISSQAAGVSGIVNAELHLHADPCLVDVEDGAALDDLVFNGLIVDEAGASIKKTGLGRVVFKELTAMPVELAGGTAIIHNAPGSQVSLNGGTLAGSGLIGALTSLAGGGRVEPGLSTGIMTNSTIAWNGATTFAVEVLNATPGTGHDQIKVFLGTVTLGGAHLEVITLPGFGTAVGQEIVLIENNGPAAITNTFAGLTNGAEVVAASSARFTVHYNGGTGNDVVLRTTFVPPTGITRTWDGGDVANNNTSDANNWNPDAVPSPGDALLFPAVADRVVNNNLTAFTPFGALTFTAGGYVVNGLPVALINGITNAATGSNIFNLPMRLMQDGTIASTAAGKLIIGTIDFGFVNLNGHTLKLHAATAASGIDFGQDAPLLNPLDGIFGAGSVVKTGPGTVAIKSFNDYTGPTLVQAGTLVVQNGDALGEIGPGNGTTVTTGATLAFNPQGDFSGGFAEDVVMDGALRYLPDSGGGGLDLVSGSWTLNFPDRQMDVPQFALTLSGVVQGAGGFRKTGAGELILGGTNANTFTGLLRVEAGTVTLRKTFGTNAVAGSVEVTGGVLFAERSRQLGAATGLTVRGPGLVDFKDTQQFLNGGLFLQGAGVSNCAPLVLRGSLGTIASATPSLIEGSMELAAMSQWTVPDGAADPDLLVLAQIFDFGSTTLRKAGSGKVVFTAPNFLSFAQLDAGTALFHGSNTTAITLNGGTLGGTGTVANLTSLAGGGIVAPGASTGILTASNVVWNPATIFAVEVRTATPGIGHDQLRVRGTVNLGAAALDVTVLSNFTATGTDTFVLIDNDGADAITGTFAGLAEGATFTEPEPGTGTPRTFRISYVGGAGNNDVTLRLVVLGTGITRTWDGGGTNNNWSVNTNWDGNLTAPAPGDALAFPAGAARLINTNNFAAGTGFDSIVVGTNYTIRGARVTLIEGLLFNFASGSANVHLPITLAQPQTFTAVQAAQATVFPTGAGASLDIAGHTLTLHADGAASRLLVSGLIGTGALVKTGPGGATLDNITHSGLTTIAEGEALMVGSATGLGTTAAGTVVSAGATLRLSNVPAQTVAEPLTLAGTLRFDSSPVTFSAGVVLPANADAAVQVSGATPTLSGVISGSAALRKTGLGELILGGTAANTFTGGATIAGGVLRLQKTTGVAALRGPVSIDGTVGAAELRLGNANQILDATSLTLEGAGALFNLNDRFETVNDLTFTGGSVVTGIGLLSLAGPLTSLAATNVATLDGAVDVQDAAVWSVEDGPVANDLVVSAVVSGKEGAALVKAGAGRAVFAGNNTLAFLRIDEGDAAITRDSSAMIALLNGGTLSGDGLIGGISNLLGGILAPGDSVGTLTSTGSVSLIERTTFAVELLNSTPGTGHDQLVVGGAVDLGFAQLSVTLLPGFTPVHGQQFTLIDNQGRDDVLNEFADLADGKELDLGAVRFRITYRGGDGNDVVLTTSLVSGTGLASRWDGGAGVGDLKWTTAANWEGDLAPKQGNALVFPSGPAQRNAQNDFPAGTTFASLDFEGGGYTLNGNRAVLNDGLVVNVPPNESGIVVSLPLKLAQTQTFQIMTNGLILDGGLDTDGQTLALNIGPSGECGVNGSPISGAGGLTKAGAGLLFLSGNNTYAGSTLLQGGRTIVGSAGALGGAGGTTIQAAELELRSAVSMTMSEPITLTSTNSLLLTTNSLVVTTNPHALTGPITLSGAGAREVRVGSRAGLTLNGRISGAGTLRKTDSGTLRLGGALANIFTGGTVVEGGSLTLSKTTSNAIPGALTLGTAGVPAFASLLSSNQIADAAIVTVRGNSSISFGSFADIIGGLVLQNSSASTDPTGLLTIHGNLQCLATPPPVVLSVASTIAGRVHVTGGVRTWSVESGLFPEELLVNATVSTAPGASLLKTGGGTLHFLNPTTISQVQIDAGPALFDLANPGTLIQLNGGLLGGAGTVSHVTALAGGGTVAPGLGLGPLTASNVTWNAATTYRCDIDEAVSDRLNALGPVNLGNATLDLRLGNAPAINDSFPLILNESGQPITGTFAGLPEGALFAVNGLVFQITYQGADADDTDGNDVQITRVAAPPSLLSGIICLPNGLKQFTGTGVPDATYVIEASTDLINWQPIGTTTADASGLYQFIDQDSLTFPHRFYRVVSP